MPTCADLSWSASRKACCLYPKSLRRKRPIWQERPFSLQPNNTKIAVAITPTSKVQYGERHSPTPISNSVREGQVGSWEFHRYQMETGHLQSHTTVSVETMQGARTPISARQKQGAPSCPAGVGSTETQWRASTTTTSYQ